MKNNSKNLKFKKFAPILLISGFIGVSTISYMTGYKDSSRYQKKENITIFNDKLNEYNENIERITNEINALKKEKNQLLNEKEFDVKDLIVAEVSNDNKNELHILYPDMSSNYSKYISISDELIMDYSCAFSDQGYDISNIPIYVEFDNKLMLSNNMYMVSSLPLTSYLSSDEIEDIMKNKGIIKYDKLISILDNLNNSDNKVISYK